LPRDQCAVLYLDCYLVHTSADFLDFLQSEYLYVIPLFVPANCNEGTPVFQPADVGLQHILKH
ncbi:uncharacterized protein FOMMEDRAFT_33011, partial [Fomitiporia mediterranea MF3/22]|uniref:uncharacterized protein n=1 Tax=Fomitiporia mediterranea (strain MF3/22) TaxID=694068 RepID=UPI0004408D54